MFRIPHLARLLTAMTVPAVAVAFAAGQGRPTTPVQPTRPGVLAPGDLDFLGYVRFERLNNSRQNCDISGMNTSALSFAARAVNGVVHFFVTQGLTRNSGFEPCEFTDPSAYRSDGTCFRNCPDKDLGSSPAAPLLTNWGRNEDGTRYDFYHGIIGGYWDETGKRQRELGFVYGSAAPVDGPPNSFYIAYSQNYGQYWNSGGLVMVTMNAANDGTGHRSSTAYGPFTVESPSKVGSVPGDGTQVKGFWNAGYFVTMPDHSFGHGFANSGTNQHGGAPTGPNLSATTSCAGCVNGWPGPTTPVGASKVIASQRNYLHYYTMDGTVDANCTVQQRQPIWAFRFAEPYPYVTERATAPGGVHVCEQGAHEGINPLTSPGHVGTWNESTYGSAMVWIDTPTKSGVIAFIGSATNHSAGNVTTCDHAHVWYCSGEDVGVEGRPCAGERGNMKSPQYGCSLPPYGDAPGPVTTHQEGRWVIYDPNDLQAVAAGKKVDYTVDPVATIFPEEKWNLPLPYEFLKAVSGAYYNPATRILYVSIPFGDSITAEAEKRPALAVFRVAP